MLHHTKDPGERAFSIVQREAAGEEPIQYFQIIKELYPEVLRELVEGEKETLK